MVQALLVFFRLVRGRRYEWEDEIILTITQYAREERVVADTLAGLEIRLRPEEAILLQQQLSEIISHLGKNSD